VPVKEAGIAQHIITAAEKMVRDERRLAAQQVVPHFCEVPQLAVEIIVGEKEKGPPPLQHDEDQRGEQQRVTE